jgi:hypothetical protein
MGRGLVGAQLAVPSLLGPRLKAQQAVPLPWYFQWEKTFGNRHKSLSLPPTNQFPFPIYISSGDMVVLNQLRPVKRLAALKNCDMPLLAPATGSPGM